MRAPAVIVLTIFVIVAILLYGNRRFRISGKPPRLGRMLDVEHVIQKRDLAHSMKAWDLEKSLDESTIFVNMPSFLDPECVTTIRELMLVAYAPWRVTWGVVDQRDDSFPECLRDLFHVPECANATSIFCMVDNVRVRRELPHRGWGPTYGRWASALMYRGESYMLGIDSHIRPTPNWDRLLILNVESIPRVAKGGKALLSSYPTGYDAPKQFLGPKGDIMVLCFVRHTSHGYAKVQARWLPTGVSRLQALIAGGFLFARSDIVDDVPFDPHLPFVFLGEELLYSARAWTHGYDIYSPAGNYLYHNYNRHAGKRFFNLPYFHYNGTKGAMRLQALLKMKSLNNSRIYTPQELHAEGADVEMDVYGMGKERSLEEFYAHLHYDVATGQHSEKLCDQAERQAHYDSH